MANGPVLEEARREVIEAAKEWARESPWQSRELSAGEQRLKMAIYMLERARAITGEIKAVQAKTGSEPGVR